MLEGYLEAPDSGDVAETSGQSQRMSLTGANKRMLHLLKRAKVQLIKIDQQKQLKMAQVIFSSSTWISISGKSFSHVF